MNIRVKDLSKSFQGREVLCHINCDFPSGMITGLTGRNGSGKTVLMKCISGYLDPDSGEILYDGKALPQGRMFPEHMGLLIEHPTFPGNLSAEENLYHLARYAHMRINHQSIADLLEMVGLEQNRKTRAAQMSLGMRQRLGLAQAFMGDPTLLILDEPFNGLDQAGVEHIRRLLLSLRDSGKTILLSSHYPEDIQLLCDSVIQLNSGKVEAIKGECR